MNFLDSIVIFILPRFLRGLFMVGVGLVYLQFFIILLLILYVFYFAISIVVQSVF